MEKNRRSLPNTSTVFIVKYKHPDNPDPDLFDFILDIFDTYEKADKFVQQQTAGEADDESDYDIVIYEVK